LARFFPVIVADLMRDRGRFNVAKGVIITAQSIGAARPRRSAGLVGRRRISHFFARPETRRPQSRSQQKTAPPASAIAAE
jgi:hypothetical protein